jgi:hypothetical protein
LEKKPNSQVLVRVDGSRRVMLRNRKFVRPLNPNLKKSVSLRLKPLEQDVMKNTTEVEHVPKNTTTRQEVTETVPNDTVVHDVEEHGGYEYQDLSKCPAKGGTVNDLLQWAIPHQSQPEPVNDQGAQDVPTGGDARGAQPEAVVTRPRRSVKPNPKYSPDTYDLNYIKIRKRSRRSVRRSQ